MGMSFLAIGKILGIGKNRIAKEAIARGVPSLKHGRTKKPVPVKPPKIDGQYVTAKPKRERKKPERAIDIEKQKVLSIDPSPESPPPSHRRENPPNGGKFVVVAVPVDRPITDPINIIRIEPDGTETIHRTINRSEVGLWQERLYRAIDAGKYEGCTFRFSREGDRDVVEQAETRRTTGGTESDSGTLRGLAVRR